ncbi:MAG: glycosyltransferase family 4 protein [Verrucomicrobia bacterium]|nr:glycosyltransferase family 4 protein [Verrucomicrobiota bacterium]
MRIAVDCRWIFQKLSGIGRHTRELVRALLDARSGDEFILLFDNDGVRRREHLLLGLVSRSDATSIVAGYGPYSLNSTVSLPRALRRLEVDVYHSPNYMRPLRRLSCASVTTIHDLIPYVAPDAIPRSRKRRLLPLYRRITRRAARLSDRLIAVSEHTKRNLVWHLGVRDEQVAVVHNGLDPSFCPATDPSARRIRERFDVHGELVIAAGRADPYKNLIALVRAVEHLVRAGRSGLRCLLIGEPDERYTDVRDYVKDNGLDTHVRFTGYLDEADLIAAYQEADVLVHPSLYEGFGLPPLEAMACGTPVVSSNRTSLPEVLGDAALLIDPENVDDLRHAIARVLDDAALRDSLRRRGLEQAQRYTWQRAATETLGVYRAAFEAQRTR